MFMALQYSLVQFLAEPIYTMGFLLSLLPKIDATITFYHSILSLAMQDGYFHTLTLFVIIFL